MAPDIKAIQPPRQKKVKGNQRQENYKPRKRKVSPPVFVSYWDLSSFN